MIDVCEQILHGPCPLRRVLTVCNWDAPDGYLTPGQFDDFVRQRYRSIALLDAAGRIDHTFDQAVQSNIEVPSPKLLKAVI